MVTQIESEEKEKICASAEWWKQGPWCSDTTLVCEDQIEGPRILFIQWNSKEKECNMMQYVY